MQEIAVEELQKKPRGCLFIGGIVLLTAILTVAITFFVITRYIFPARFEPVTLSESEQQILEGKLERFEIAASSTRAATSGEQNPGSDVDELSPEKYTEVGAKRQITLSERELNGLLAANTDLAERLVIDLSENLASGKLLIPLDPDFPVMGGKTLKITAGMELAYRGDKPVVVLRGVSVMGVPLPAAWLGNMKNVDLVREFGADPGFWKSFAEGVENVRVSDGKLVMQLRE